MMSAGIPARSISGIFQKLLCVGNAESRFSYNILVSAQQKCLPSKNNFSTAAVTEHTLSSDNGVFLPHCTQASRFNVLCLSQGQLRSSNAPFSTLTFKGLHSSQSLQGQFQRSFSTSLVRAAKDLSEKGDVVYKGAISGMIRGVKIFSLSTSILGVCLQPMLLLSSQELPTGLKFAVGGMLNFFVFANPIIIHYIAKKYVTELRWNRTTGVFTAATWSLFCTRKELEFKAEDVKVPDVPGMFTSLEVKGMPLFMEPQAFTDNEAYVRLMGFDKPLDWELPSRGSEGDEIKQSQKG